MNIVFMSLMKSPTHHHPFQNINTLHVLSHALLVSAVALEWFLWARSPSGSSHLFHFPNMFSGGRGGWVCVRGKVVDERACSQNRVFNSGPICNNYTMLVIHNIAELWQMAAAPWGLQPACVTSREMWKQHVLLSACEPWSHLRWCSLWSRTWEDWPAKWAGPSWACPCLTQRCDWSTAALCRLPGPKQQNTNMLFWYYCSRLELLFCFLMTS